MAETTELKKSDFYFDLPQELIAQDPLEDRSSSRLLVLDKNTGEISHHIFRDIIDYLHPGDCLVLNNTKVIPARLLGEREGTGGHVEVLLLKRKEADVWETLVKPGKKCKPGQRLTFGDGLLKAEVLETVAEGNRLMCSLQCFLRRLYFFFFGNILCCLVKHRFCCLLAQNIFCQRFQTLLLCNTGTGLSLGTIGAVQILYHYQRLGCQNLLL